MADTILGRHPLPRLLLALLLSGLIGFVAPGRVAAVACIVTSADDSGAGTLRAHLADPGCDAITFDLAAMGSGSISLASTLPTITGPLAITGPGRDSLTVQGNNTFPLMVVNAPGQAVAIGGLTLTGGHAIGGYGGNLRSVGGHLALTDLALTDATAAASMGGAGAYLSNGTSALTRVVVSGNSAPGSTMYGTGAGLYVDDYYGSTQVTIADSSISGNTATANRGGGIAIVQFNSRSLDVRLVNSVVGTVASPNRAEYGGGIYNNGGNVTLTNSTVGGNQANFYGGGIYSSYVSLVLTDSTVVGNRSKFAGGIAVVGGQATLTNVTLSGNSAESIGGLYNYRSTATLTNVTISGNQSTSDRTGGLLNTLATVTLLHATVVDNTGGVYTGGTSGGPTITRLRASVIVGNGAQDCTTSNASDASVTSQGYNVVGSATGCPVGIDTGDVAITGASSTVLDPALTDNGGPTRTHALVTGSPALDRIPIASCAVSTDQRGVARPNGPQCDSGAVESAAAPNPSPSPGAQPTLTTATVGSGTVGRVPAGTGGGPYRYPPGTVVTLTPQPGAGQSFVGWTVDGAYKGWAPSLTVTMAASHDAQATFAPTASFPDVGGGRADYAAIVALATRGTIRGYASGNYGPDDTVQRAQMAALIARATSAGPDTPPTMLTPPACLAGGTWDCEDWGAAFSDRQGLDANLWRNVGALQHYRVAFGYDGAACAARGVASPCYGPSEAVTYAQTITFITRMMKAKGYWQDQPGASHPYGGVPGPHAADVATFAYYTGGVPAPPGDWNAGATRGWFARALWDTLNSYWGTDGTLPDGFPTGGHVP